MHKSLICWLAVVGLAVVGACKDSGPKGVGPPAALAVVEGPSQSAPANTDLPGPIRIAVRDANGTTLGAGHTVVFQVVAGGGSLPANSATTDESGTVTAPTWRLGKSALPQRIRASLDNITTDVSATVATQYNITVRFWGEPMSAAHQELFANAAARISGFITGDVVDANGGGVDLAAECDVTGQPPLNEIIDDILIFASIQAIDGSGKVLASTFPCLARKDANLRDMIAVGVMEFDSADLNTLAGGGSLQDVIVHEMLHALGFGTLWNNRTLLTGSGTADPRFTGVAAQSACVAAGGTGLCQNGVAVEGTGGPGTANAHWRESGAFVNELMTGFLNSGVNPLSAITIGSMTDLGFVVNMASADPYMVPGGLIRAGASLVAPAYQHAGWERVLPLRGILLPNGRVQRVTFK